MVQITGKYSHEKSENFMEYLKTFGSMITPEVLNQYANSKPTVEVELNGDNCKIASSSGQVQKFTFGQTYKDDMFPDQDVENTATLKGNKIEMKSVNKTTGRDTSRIYEFTDTGLIVHYLDAAVKAKRYYTRD